MSFAKENEQDVFVRRPEGLLDKSQRIDAQMIDLSFTPEPAPPNSSGLAAKDFALACRRGCLRFTLQGAGMDARAAARVRRVLLDDLRAGAIDFVYFDSNTSRTIEAMVVQQLYMVDFASDAMLGSMKAPTECDCGVTSTCERCAVVITLKAKNVDDRYYLPVTTADIRVNCAPSASQREPITAPLFKNLTLLTLRCKKELSLKASLRLGSKAKNDHVRFASVDRCAFKRLSSEPGVPFAVSSEMPGDFAFKVYLNGKLSPSSVVQQLRSLCSKVMNLGVGPAARAVLERPYECASCHFRFAAAPGPACPECGGRFF